MKKIGLIIIAAFLAISFAEAQENESSGHVPHHFQQSILNKLAKEKQTVQAQLDSICLASDGQVEFSEDDVVIAQRIQRIQNVVPLEYNDRVKAYLSKYVSNNYKPYIEKLLGLSQYYFPIYEQILGETGVPEEVKFLSVVESSLNPHTVSTSGAVGPWQFMYNTAKAYDLIMDGMIDERKDVFSTTYAVSKYLSEAHAEFNDWLLALASYNCGRGCVRRAIQRSGLNNPSFWELSPFLPKETQNYIPKYIAMVYVLNHANQHGLVARQEELVGDYSVVMVDRHIDISSVAVAVNTPIGVLKQFNPAYKHDIINGTPEAPRRLIIPQQEGVQDSMLYVALNTPVSVGEEIRTSYVSANDAAVDKKLASNVSKAAKKMPDSSPKYVVHTVRKGDTLSGIASKYKNATVAKLRADNNIKGSHLKIGAKIRVYQGKG